MGDQFFGVAELRVPPEAIPAVREVLNKMLDDIEGPLRKLRRDGRLLEPWLHDPVSVSVADAYNKYVLDEPDGMLAAIVKYREQIIAAVEALTDAEKQYQHTESDLVLKLT
ncbi:hypothetical protein ACQEVB_06405 [Pseudonocardia sp. CA-107938]|uniref:hypothetical protein n=1 Tax=Pseudonocardia sp. CA-107938 TaxID=3240021 RepID=UPI003D8E73AD